nr:helix-turn-helix transcriptional regulator [Streptomyces sp. NBC_00857]
MSRNRVPAERRIHGPAITLRRPEDHGFVDRTVYPAVPLHVEYALTALGHGVAESLGQVCAWVENHLDDIRSSGTASDAEEGACVSVDDGSSH